MTKVYEHTLKVEPADIDALKHVNNEVYLRWLLNAATAHSRSLGYGVEKFLAGGGVFVVRRHELDYLSPAYLGEELIVRTWIAGISVAKSEREYEIVRPADGKTLMRAKTLWVYVDVKTGRPKEIPSEMLETYRPYVAAKNAESKSDSQ